MSLISVSAFNILNNSSNIGLVNMYGPEAFSTQDRESDSSSPPKVVKTIENLTTSISSMKFNFDAQLLALASKEKKDAVKLVSQVALLFYPTTISNKTDSPRLLQVHVPSLTTYSNWPTSSTPLGHVTALDFSPKSEYVAMGNTRGKVLLYHLRHYGFAG